MRRHQADGAGVHQLTEAEAAVFLGDLDAEGADLLQRAHHVVGHLAVAIDGIAVDSFPKHVGEARQKGRRRSLIRCSWAGIGIDQVEFESSGEQFAHEARLRPFGFARRLGGGAGLFGCRGLGHEHLQDVAES